MILVILLLVFSTAACVSTLTRLHRTTTSTSVTRVPTRMTLVCSTARTSRLRWYAQSVRILSSRRLASRLAMVWLRTRLLVRLLLMAWLQSSPTSTIVSSAWTTSSARKENEVFNTWSGFGRSFFYLNMYK